MASSTSKKGECNHEPLSLLKPPLATQVASGLNRTSRRAGPGCDAVRGATSPGVGEAGSTDKDHSPAGRHRGGRGRRGLRRREGLSLYTWARQARRSSSLSVSSGSCRDAHHEALQGVGKRPRGSDVRRPWLLDGKAAPPRRRATCKARHLKRRRRTSVLFSRTPMEKRRRGRPAAARLPEGLPGV